MKKLIVATLVALATIWSAPVEAQTYLRNTTLSANITATQTQFAIASATGVEVGGVLFVDHEPMPIQAVSGTTVTVLRTQKPLAHASGAVVYVGTKAQRATNFLVHSAARRMGQCSTSTSVVPQTALTALGTLPIIDVDTGDVYMCRKNGASGSWVWNVTNVQSLNGEAGSTPTVFP